MPRVPTTTQVIAAEARFVTEGHHVRLDTGRHCFLVKSDSRPGLTYEVTVAATPDGRLLGTCTCPAGRKAAHGVNPVPCKHVGGTMNRGEREGWAAFVDGRWLVAGPLVEAVA